MREKILDIVRKSTYLPRKVLDNLIFAWFLKRSNQWSILQPFFEKDILVVGNGPSLNQTPLSKIHMVSIGMNKINLIYDKTDWRPDIIACVNGLVLSQNKDFFNKTETILILPVRAWYLGVKKRKNIIFVNLSNDEKLNDDISKEISAGCTVTFYAMQIATHLKAKSINIVGVDHNFSFKGKEHDIQKMDTPDPNHFSPDYFKDQFWALPNLDHSERLYNLVKDYCDNHKIPVTDYTVEGKLQVFKKGSIENLMNQNVKFKNISV